VYLGLVNETTVKFGYSNNIHNRVKEHQREIHKDFSIRYVYESVYNREIEKEIKRHKFLSNKIKTKEINSKKQTELIELDDELSFEDLNNIIIEIRDEVESYEKDKDKTLLIEKLTYELKVLKTENEELKDKNTKIENEINLTSTENKLLKQIKIYTYSNARIEDLQKSYIELKKNVFMHFFINFIANNLKLSNNPYTSIRMSYGDMLRKYKEYRKRSSYMEPFHSDHYELRMIAKFLNGIPGIEFYTPDNSPRIRVFGIKTIGEWIARNCILPSQHRGMFLNLVIKNDFYQRVTKKKDIPDEIKHVHRFVVMLLMKNISESGVSSSGNNVFRECNKTHDTKTICILNKLILDEYLHFYVNDSYKKKLTIKRINEIIKSIPGVYINHRILQNENKRAIRIETSEIIPWVLEHIKLEYRYEYILNQTLLSK
jgi:predicted GIY-YIG superfamily endonuclease